MAADDDVDRRQAALKGPTIVTTRTRLLAALFALTAAVAVVPPAAAGQRSDPKAASLLPARGETSARVVILLFSDFECPYCARVEPVLSEVRQAFPKDVQVIFKHNPLPIHPRAPLAHEAAVEAGRQGQFWEMHDLLFANQGRLEEPQLVEYAQRLNLDMTTFRAALADRRHRPVVERDAAEARALGLNATPTLFINGQRLVGVPPAPQLNAFIKSVLTGRPITTEAEPPLPPGTLDLSGSPSRGPADARVTLVEFSDFQCPFCARGRRTTEAVFKKYEGRVRWVFKHFPLDFHPDAPLAHRAAMAAAEQGKFWEMHEKIFESQRAMKRDDLIAMATALGLDMPRFTADLGSDKFTALMQRDMTEAMKVGVDGTPTLFINGRRLVGAKPEAELVAVIESELNGTTPAAYTRPAPGESVPAETLERAMSRGAADAPVTIQWYADIASALHRDSVTVVKRLLEAHPADVRLVFKSRPVARDTGKWLLHEASVAAAEQGRFWEVHDLLLMRPGQTRESLSSAADRLGLDRAWFDDALATGRARAAIERDLKEAASHDVRGAPTFLVNGKRIDGVPTTEQLEAAVTEALGSAKTARR